MNKILLIIPRSAWLLDERVFPALGILKVASAFEQQGEVVDVLDLNGIENWEKVIDLYFEENKQIKFAGITATTPQMPDTFRLAQYIKNIRPETKIVLGGSHPTAMNAAHKSEKKRNVVEGRANQAIETLLEIFDVLVCGDGELTLNEINNTSKGIIDADDRKSSMFLTDKQFDELPNPARWLLDIKSYKYTIDGNDATSIIAQLGCPFNCQFCGMRQSPSMRLIRNRTVGSIVNEIKSLYLTYGYKGYMFYDDELNVSKSMIELMNSLTDLQMELGISFSFRGFLKSELTTEEQLVAMKRAGFSWLLCGFESANERILKNIEKKATVDDNTRFIELAKRHGLKTKALCSAGHCGESFESINDTKEWLIKMEVEDFDQTVITTFGGSPYYDLANKLNEETYVYVHPKSGDKLYQEVLDYTKQADYYKGKPDEYKSYVWTDYISSEDLVKERNKLEVEVREKLKLPFNPSGGVKQFEHSMGQGLPDNILRSTLTHQPESRPAEVPTAQPTQAIQSQPELPVEHQPVISKRKLSIIQ